MSLNQTISQEEKERQIDAAWEQHEQNEREARKREFNSNFYKAEAQRYGKSK